MCQNDRHQLLQVITWFECNFKQISLMSVVFENDLVIIGKVPAILKSIQKEFYYLRLCSEGVGCSSTTFVVLHLNCSVHSQLDLSKSFSGRWNKYLIELALGSYWRNIILKLIYDSSSSNKGNHDNWHRFGQVYCSVFTGLSLSLKLTFVRNTLLCVVFSALVLDMCSNTVFPVWYIPSFRLFLQKVKYHGTLLESH